jgi:RHS repeat-associated protein
VYDGLGSVVGEVDPLGNLTCANEYDVYGAVRGRTGTATTAHGFVGSLGHLSDASTGLIYMRARYYDPVTGSFDSQDQRHDGGNWFAYCNNNPVNGTDPTGHSLLLLTDDLDEAAAEVEGAAQDSGIEGMAERLVMLVDERMAAMSAVFTGLFEDTRGGQMVIQYMSSITGRAATFRFDFPAGAVDLAGFARNAFNTTGEGHSWGFDQAIQDILSAGL